MRFRHLSFLGTVTGRNGANITLRLQPGAGMNSGVGQDRHGSVACKGCWWGVESRRGRNERE